MFKKALSVVVVAMLIIAFGVSPVMAADVSSVAIGADNNEEQINTVYGLFGIERGSVPEVKVTNGDEKALLSKAIPAEKIGNVALSCVYINAMSDGGIDLKTHNINYVTEDMYKSALATAGINNAKVVVAAYKPVSGTGALAGIYKAYEDATGIQISEEIQGLTAEELVVLGQLQESLGDDSTKIINEIKSKLKETKNMTDDQIRQLINDTAASYNAVIYPEDVERILGLIKQMNELGVDPDTFLKLAQAGQQAQGFGQKVADFFKGIGDFFTNLFK